MIIHWAEKIFLPCINHCTQELHRLTNTRSVFSNTPKMFCISRTVHSIVQYKYIKSNADGGSRCEDNEMTEDKCNVTSTS